MGLKQLQTKTTSAYFTATPSPDDSLWHTSFSITVLPKARGEGENFESDSIHGTVGWAPPSRPQGSITFTVVFKSINIWERERTRDRPATGSPSKWSRWLGLGQSRSQVFLGVPCGWRAQGHVQSSVAFPGSRARNPTSSGASRTWISTHWDASLGQQVYLHHHNASSRNAVFNQWSERWRHCGLYVLQNFQSKR